MDASIVTALIGGGSGLAAGIIVSLFAPWINWEIEKRRQKHDSQRQLLRTARDLLISKNFIPQNFRTTSTYARLKPDLSSEVHKSIEQYANATAIVEAEENMELLKTALLSDLVRLERQWGLL